MDQIYIIKADVCVSVCLSEHRENVCLSVCLSEHLLSVRTDRLTDDMKWYILTILQVLYLPPPKGEEKAAGGGLFASHF